MLTMHAMSSDVLDLHEVGRSQIARSLVARERTLVSSCGSKASACHPASASRRMLSGGLSLKSPWSMSNSTVSRLGPDDREAIRRLSRRSVGPSNGSSFPAI